MCCVYHAAKRHPLEQAVYWIVAIVVLDLCVKLRAFQTDLATALSMREQQAVDVQRLATMGAGAQDVVRLHIRMLKETGSWTTPTGERAFGVDAHLALVEWLGTLADLYRDASIHARGNP